MFVLTLWAGVSLGQTSVVYTVDNTRSAVTISGTLLGLPLIQQAPGSLTTTFSGTIDATVNNATNAIQVQFPSSGIVAAEDSGSWEPLATGASGNEPANYGFSVAGPIPDGIAIPPIPGVNLSGFEAVTALRDLELTIGSPALAIDAAGAIPGTQLVAEVVMGNVAVSVDFLATTLLGTIPFTVTNFTFALTNAVTTNRSPVSSITTTNGIETLCIELDANLPIDFDSLVPFAAATTNGSFFQLQGNLVATRTLPTLQLPPTNQPPVLGAIPNQFVTAGTVLDVALSALDPDAGQTLNYNASGPGVSVSSNVVTITTTPADAFTIATISMTVTDDGSPPRSDTKTLQVHIAGDPVITNIVPSTTAHNIAFQSMAGFTYELEIAPWLSTNETFIVAGSTTATNRFGGLSLSAPFSTLQFFRVRLRP